MQPNTSVFSKTARLSLCLLLVSAQFASANPTQRVIFPGDKLPAELTYKPLKIGSDIQVSARDWFMLKDKDLAISSPVPGKTIDYVGPVLDSNNAQIYFRIVSGMILKESMVRMGMNPSQAVRFLEAAQENNLDLATTPLNKLGALPKGLAELNENWDRPLYKMALLPYLMLPLSVAMDQSNLQHFALGQTDDKPAQKFCSAITSVYPLGLVQTRINDRTKNLDNLASELLIAKSRLQQSTAEQVRMTQDLRKYSGEIDGSLSCFASVTDRISRGGAMPSEACLKMAQGVLAEAKLQEEWTKFSAKNLKNDNGDYTDKQKSEEKMKNLEARLAETEKQILALKDQQTKASQEQADAREKVVRLNTDLTAQKAEEDKSSSEKNALQTEMTTIQNLNHKLEMGTFEGNETEKQAASTPQAMADRAKRLAAIRARLSQILQTEVKFQVNQAAIVRQIEFLTSTIDQKKTSIESAVSQLSEPASGLEAKAAALRTEVKVATGVYLKASEEAKFSEYVISILNKRLSELSKFRDNLFATVKKEEAASESYKTQIAAAQKVLDTQTPGLSKDLTDLEAMVASYKDPANMGWFLETECEARANFSQGKPGVYLSRAKITPPAGTPAPAVAARVAVGSSAPAAALPKISVSPSDSGRWGLFNMDFNVFKAAIQNGVLLSMPSNIQMAVQQIIENYDYALTQQLDPAAQKCADTDRANVGNSMKVAFSVWFDGNDAKAKSKAVACRQVAAGAPVDASLTSVREFQASLGKLIAFEGTLVDAALPKAGQSHPKDLIEREAIVNLGRELAPLAGFPRKGAGDREVLIKALVRILATDYEAEAKKQRLASADASKYEFVFATEAPGGAATGGANLVEGQEYSVNTLAALPLYVAPVADAKYAAGLQVSFRDKVTVLSPVRAGWVKVMAKQRELWMAARPLTSQVLTDESGREVAGYTKLQNCEDPKLVSLRGGRLNITRYASNLQTATDKKGVSRIDTAKTSKVAPANPSKTYISCEKFSLNGQVAALRLVEVQVLKARNGETTYLPAEDVGGYVLMNAQITEGAGVNPMTWSTRQ